MDRLKEMIVGLGVAPGEEAENVLFLLAESERKFYSNHTWREAVIRRGTLSASERFVDLIANGAFNDAGVDSWDIAREVGGLISTHTQLRARVYQLLEEGAPTPGLALLVRAVEEDPDADGLLLLAKLEMGGKGQFISRRAIENVVTEHVPSEGWKGVYEINPVPAIKLRQKLLAMTTDGGLTDTAARCLNQIDKIRDDHGTPDSEPRHPDLKSGKPWPILVADLDE